MGLLSYYAFHSIKNQIKKLFKTWVFIFLAACILIGGLIGFSAVALSDLASGEDDVLEEEYIDEDISEDETVETEWDSSFFGDLGVETKDIIELVIGGIILMVFVFEAVSVDKNGSSIFVPADVNLLFPSPMKPQSVLLFRLMTRIGALVIASAYLLFQIPNLVISLGLSVWQGLAFIAAWYFTIVIGKLLQMLLYTVASTHIKIKSHLRKAVYAILAFIAAAYFVFWKQSGTGYLEASVRFFNAEVTRYIPVWGWLKGLCMCACEGNLTAALAYLLALVISAAVLIYIIWHVKADFYEDAMAKSEETAELLERAQSEKSGGVVFAKRKKDRSDKLRRDEMKHGSGANVFFFKTLYNRFRFAHFGIFTKTAETYLVAAIGVSLLCRLVFQVNGLIPTALTLAGFVFYRSLGNPLGQDIKMDCFRMIPESAWAKLFWSLIGGTVNCLLDVLPAMIVAVVIIGTNPLPALAWIVFIVSVDFYATNVGAFIDLSVPVSAGKMVKQIVQIMFIYFGLLPEAVIIIAGFILGHIAAAAVCAGIFNIGLGFIFFALSPLFIVPKGGR